jgi:asparagine synthase (glutamine-hydrolysing)
MCGIYGAIGENYKNIENPFKESLYHRGPDDSGFFTDDNAKIGLGHNRLSIIDLSNNAHQPMADDSGRFTIVFNGEIYNYQELKYTLEKEGFQFTSSSDTEVVLKGFMHWKEECLNKLRGMFAFVIFDKKTNHLFIARDRVGIKPLLYFNDGKQFIFASELKPFLVNNIIPNKINLNAVQEYFSYGGIKQPNTMLLNVFHLMPGHYMSVSKDLTVKTVKYYDVKNNINNKLGITSYNDAVSFIRKEFEEATKYHIISDVEVGAFLSGGVDSTAVVSLMKKLSTKNIYTFSLGFNKQSEVTDESDVAKRSAETLGTIHSSITVDDKYISNIIDNFIYSLDQPSNDGINTYIISKETSNKIKVALSGLGGDEIFAGYNHFRNIYNYSGCKKNVVSTIGEKLNNIKANRFTYKYAYYEKTPETSLNKHRVINSELSSLLNVTESIENIEPKLHPNLSTLQRISVAEIEGYLRDTLLRDCDAVSMAHSLEVRPILLDHKLIESTLSLPDEFKLHNGILKSLFIDVSKDIIPEEVWRRKKTGFVMPYVSWLNGVLNNKFYQEFQNFQIKEIFNQSYLIELNNRIIKKKLVRKDWLTFIFISWMNTNKLSL